MKYRTSRAHGDFSYVFVVPQGITHTGLEVGNIGELANSGEVSPFMYIVSREGHLENLLDNCCKKKHTNRLLHLALYKKKYYCSCICALFFVPLPHNFLDMEHLSKSQVKWVRSLQQKKYRDEHGVFVAEGKKCVEELRSAFELVLLATPENTTDTEIEQMSSLRTPQGIIGVFRKPTGNYQLSTGNSPLLLALDGVQDPGNLGTIIRTCDWFGIHDIICSHDTADCYNSKVVQATMGALARVRVHYVDLPKVLVDSKAQGIPLYGTLLEGKNMYHANAIPNKQHGIIIMGNEGNGISQAVREIITHPLLIPSYPTEADTSESLNVGIATAIVLAEFRRK